jgi:hypothetical protein
LERYVNDQSISDDPKTQYRQQHAIRSGPRQPALEGMGKFLFDRMQEKLSVSLEKSKILHSGRPTSACSFIKFGFSM